MAFLSFSLPSSFLVLEMEASVSLVDQSHVCQGAGRVACHQVGVGDMAPGDLSCLAYPVSLANPGHPFLECRVHLEGLEDP